MLDFGKYIKELLLEHDCVILPGLGGFVANYRPASFDPVKNTASPPSKHILFNQNLIHNDGLLYGHVSARTGYGYKDVQEMALSYIEGIAARIGEGLKHDIEGLGYFFRNTENQVQFSEEQGTNFLLESYGLPFIQYHEIEVTPKPESYRALSTEADPAGRQKRIRQLIYGAAAACILAAIIIIPIRTTRYYRVGMDIPGSDSFRKEQISHSRQLGPAAEQSSGTSSTGKRKTLILPAFPEPEFNIVVGSFNDFGNARALRNQLVEEGLNARILGTDKGFFRVSAGTYSFREEASRELAAIRHDFGSAWILSN
jgi:hypothetical protein